MAYVFLKSEWYLRSFSTHPLVLRCFLIIVWCRLEVTDARIYRLAHCHDTGWCQLADDAGWRREYRECWILPVILIYMPSLFMPVVHKHAESLVGMQVNDFHHAILRLEVFTGNLCHIRSLVSIDNQCILWMAIMLCFSCISGRCTNSGWIILYEPPILQATFGCEISKVSNPGITPLKLRLMWIGKSCKRPIACTKQTTQWTQICIDSRIRRNSKQNDCIAENTRKTWIHSLQTLPITIGLNLNTPTHPHTRTFNLC